MFAGFGYSWEIECDQESARIIEAIFATMKEAIDRHDGTALTIYSRLSPPEDHPAHYQGFGLTAKIHANLGRRIALC